MINFIKNIMQLMLAPSSGWEDLSYADHNCEQLVQQRMYPLFGIAAVTEFMQMIYHPELSLEKAFMCAVGIFVSLFVTYFFANMMMRQYADKFFQDRYDSTKVCIVSSYTLCLLALAISIVNFLPTKLGFNYLLPLGVALVFWKSSAYLKVLPGKDFAYACFGTMVLIVPPFLVQWLFDATL